MFVLKEELFLHYRPPVQFARSAFLLRTSMIALSPALLLTVWSLMYTSDQVYAVSIPPAVSLLNSSTPPHSCFNHHVHR